MRRLLLGAAVALLVCAPSAQARNRWLGDKVLNMAHQGGEAEFPSNTMYAFRKALALGADTLELDVSPTKDGTLVVMHDWQVDRTTDGTGYLADLTLAQVRKLDAAYNFVPGRNAVAGLPARRYPFRGVRTGAKKPPKGFTRNDFRVPTLAEVLKAFPHTPINIEIKMVKIQGGANGGCTTDNGVQYCDDIAASMPVADALADLLDERRYASRDDIIVVSFGDALIDEFHSRDDGGNVALAPGVSDTTAFALLGTTPVPDVAAFQVPPTQFGIDVPALLLNTRHAHDLGYAVHVWTNGDQDETDASYRHLYDLGVDGIMTSDPSRLAAFLCANDIPRPDGKKRCNKNKLKRP
jgi:glycerophosphoryl diester phosphodiesterase